LKEKEEAEKESSKRAEINYNDWKSKKEKEDSQIDEMFNSLRIYR